MKFKISIKQITLFVAGLILLIVSACSTPSATPRPPSNTEPTLTVSPEPTNTARTATTPYASVTPSQKSVTIVLSAQNNLFSLKTITVPDGAIVNINFNNQDSGISHNFAVYQNLTGGQVKPIFIGNFILGPATSIYTFTAPSTGPNYFFDCDNHPQNMNGQFIVT